MDEPLAPRGKLAPEQGRAALQLLRRHLPKDQLEARLERGQWQLVVPKERLLEVATLLSRDPSTRYQMPLCMTCVDWPERERRFDVVYLLRSLLLNDLAWITVLAAEDTELPSLAAVLPGMEWHERECFDLFGLRFSDHPDLTRILLPDDWEGHPLRKDYVSFGEPVAFTHNIEWALSAQDRPGDMPGATRGAVERS